MANPFVRKGYGRIFATKEEDFSVVMEAIKACDEFELDYFSPSIFCVLGPDVRPTLVYTHKFEADMDALTLYCWRRGVHIWCVSQHNEDFNPGKD